MLAIDLLSWMSMARPGFELLIFDVDGNPKKNANWCYFDADKIPMQTLFPPDRSSSCQWLNGGHSAALPMTCTRKTRRRFFFLQPGTRCAPSGLHSNWVMECLTLNFIVPCCKVIFVQYQVIEQVGHQQSNSLRFKVRSCFDPKAHEFPEMSRTRGENPCAERMQQHVCRELPCRSQCSELILWNYAKFSPGSAHRVQWLRVPILVLTVTFCAIFETLHVVTLKIGHFHLQFSLLT